MLRTLKQHAYEVIREKLLTGVVKPGHRISDDKIAQELKISRAPVREAISQLVSEGLVDYRPRSGAYVKRPDRREVEELYEIRESLEGYAARKAALNISPADLAKLGQLVDEMDAFVRECRGSPMQTVVPTELMQRYLASDLAFHTLILDTAGNSRLRKLVTDSRILVQIFAAEPRTYDVRALCHGHRGHRHVLEAIQKRDEKAAGLCMTEHIRSAKRLMMRYTTPTAPG
jgi:DNA-binding GntR family transcriptional regulator